MSLDQRLGGGDFIVAPAEKVKQVEDKKLSFSDQIDEIRKDLTVEEHRLRHLTDRFFTLETSVTRLQEEIDQERYLHRKLIDEILEGRTEEVCDCTVLPEKPPVDVMTIDHESIKEKIRSLTSSVDRGQSSSNEEVDLNRMKGNLEMYRLEISEMKRKEISKKKRNATVKMLKDHLEFIEKTCDHEIMKLENIQQDIRQLAMRDDMDTHLEMIYRTDSCDFQTNSESPSQTYSFNDSNKDLNEHEYLPQNM